jgi:hypothetical protein
MDSPIIYINSFINDYKLNNEKFDIEDFQSQLYKKFILTKYDKESNLMLLYHKFDQPTNSLLERECRSVVLDVDTLKVVSYTCENPICNNEAQQLLINNTNTLKMQVFKCYEGSLLSLFNHNDKWYLSTRRCLDSKNSVWNSISHYDMFIDVLTDEGLTFEEFTSKLDPNYGYYFVLIHHLNKHVIDYKSIFGDNYTKLSVAFIRNKETQLEVDLKMEGYKNIFMAEEMTIEQFDEENKNLNININTEGIIIKIKSESEKDKLLKLQSISYQFSKTLGKDSNIYKGYIYLYQCGSLKSYIDNYENHKNFGKIVNPKNTNEAYDTIGVVDSIFKVLSSEFFELFKILWNIKNGEKQDNSLYKFIPKEYKDVLFALRGLYYKIKADYINSEFKLKNTFGIKDVYQYFKSLNVEIICAILRQRRLMFNWVILNNDSDLQLFKNISNRCDKVHFKLIAIYTNKLFPDIMPNDIPQIVV